MRSEGGFGGEQSMRPSAIVIIALLIVRPATGDVDIDRFVTDVALWQRTMEYGDVSACRASSGEGREDGRALRADFDFRATGVNHIAFNRDVSVDLSWCRGISFDVRGTGDRVTLYVHLYDSKGERSCYSVPDSHTGHDAWHTCVIPFNNESLIEGGNADLSDIRSIALMLNDTGPKKGVAWFDNLIGVDVDESVTFAPAVISPNGDGVYDALVMLTSAPRGSVLTVDVFDEGGERVATPISRMPAPSGRFEVSWDGRSGDEVLADGSYEVRVSFGGKGEGLFVGAVSIENRPPWPVLSYRLPAFFPVGVWMEGSAGLFADYPDDPAAAEAYYDKCFADLVANGFNVATVPNVPEAFQEILLGSAEEAGLKVILPAYPLWDLAHRTELVSETDAHRAAKGAIERLGDRKALFRYQISDEPSYAHVANWIVLQRITAAVDPTRPVFSCFAGWRPEVLSRVVSAAPMAEVPFDEYPITKDTPVDSLGAFVEKLDNLRAAAGPNPLWMVLQAFASPAFWRYPTAGELRAMTYLSLAAGAKGVFYFLYQTFPDGSLQGLIDAGGEPRPIYAHVAEVNRELNQLAPLLAELKLSEEKSPVMSRTTSGEEGSFARVGTFTDKAGRHVLVVASTRPDTTVTAVVSTSRIESWEDALTHDVIRPEQGRLTLTLARGAGRVVIGPVSGRRASSSVRTQDRQ